ncbi:putative membrane protein [Caldalkalibacillus uzonensis]|uniref:Membrane protein n=1 Tax=Caldalkalibacillus uzonensis TaxID=353224 RepID=A0ABU0CR38_9BACI|nr:hypothetical protein [Caldalkalibacillus uzonensis]MDQ0338890.1 putative membrane protein [Caldalkalibacillus uzonensis]
MDADNFELMLRFSEQTEKIEMSKIWNTVSAYIAKVKEKVQWEKHKEDKLAWKEGILYVNGLAINREN